MTVIVLYCAAVPKPEMKAKVKIEQCELRLCLEISVARESCIGAVKARRHRRCWHSLDWHQDRDGLPSTFNSEPPNQNVEAVCILVVWYITPEAIVYDGICKSNVGYSHRTYLPNHILQGNLVSGNL